jgi:hypothetical protein
MAPHLFDGGRSREWLPALHPIYIAFSSVCAGPAGRGAHLKALTALTSLLIRAPLHSAAIEQFYVAAFALV